MSVEKLDTVKKAKSRHQSTFEYFEALQIEWIQGDLRTKIYPRLKDKSFWKRYKDGKKVTILDIAARNGLPTIFDDDQLEQDLRKRVYKDEGFPNFIYKNQQDQLQQEYYDLMYYFNVGAEVRFEYFGETKVSKVKEYRQFKRLVVILFEGQEIELPIEKVTRIL